jgi:hypothetical protein
MAESAQATSRKMGGRSGTRYLSSRRITIVKAAYNIPAQ